MHLEPRAQPLDVDLAAVEALEQRRGGRGVAAHRDLGPPEELAVADVAVAEADRARALANLDAHAHPPVAPSAARPERGEDAIRHGDRRHERQRREYRSGG